MHAACHQHRAQLLIRDRAVRAQREVLHAAVVAAVQLRLNRLRHVQPRHIQQPALDQIRQLLITFALLIRQKAAAFQSTAARAVAVVQRIRIKRHAQPVKGVDEGKQLFVRHAGARQQHKRLLAAVVFGIDRVHADNHILHLVKDALTGVGDLARLHLGKQRFGAGRLAGRQPRTLLHIVVAAVLVAFALHPGLRVLP